MFNSFLTALIQKITAHLAKHPEKFGNFDKLSVPKSFKAYLENTNEKKFMDDLKLALNFIQDPKNANVKNNKLFIALLEFLTNDLARKIDHLDGNFYLLEKSKRQEIVNQLIKADTTLAETLKEILVNNTYQQIADSVQNLAQKVNQSPHILVQSPREIDTELKKQIRTHLSEQNPLTLPIFQINRKLIGGLRVFKNGESVDHSWISRVLRFTSLTAN